MEKLISLTPIAVDVEIAVEFPKPIIIQNFTVFILIFQNVQHFLFFHIAKAWVHKRIILLKSQYGNAHTNAPVCIPVGHQEDIAGNEWCEIISQKKKKKFSLGKDYTCPLNQRVQNGSHVIFWFQSFFI